MALGRGVTSLGFTMLMLAVSPMSAFAALAVGMGAITLTSLASLPLNHAVDRGPLQSPPLLLAWLCSALVAAVGFMAFTFSVTNETYPEVVRMITAPYVVFLAAAACRGPSLRLGWWPLPLLVLMVESWSAWALVWVAHVLWGWDWRTFALCALWGHCVYTDMLYWWWWWSAQPSEPAAPPQANDAHDDLLLRIP